MRKIYTFITYLSLYPAKTIVSYFLSSTLISKEVNLGNCPCRANSKGKGLLLPWPSAAFAVTLIDVRFTLDFSVFSSFVALMWLTLTDAVAGVVLVASASASAWASAASRASVVELIMGFSSDFNLLAKKGRATKINLRVLAKHCALNQKLNPKLKFKLQI